MIDDDIRESHHICVCGDKYPCTCKCHSPSRYGELGMKELLIKSLIPTYEEIDIDGFEFTVDNHMDRYGVPARATTTTLKFKLKNGKWVKMTIE